MTRLRVLLADESQGGWQWRDGDATVNAPIAVGGSRKADTAGGEAAHSLEEPIAVGGSRKADTAGGEAAHSFDAKAERAHSSSRQALAIVPAARMRTLLLSIPPTPADKLEAVIRFALEDQLAGDVDLQHVVIGSRRTSAARVGDDANDRRGAIEVLVHVMDRRWLIEALDRLAVHGIAVTRVVAESDIAPRDADALGTWIVRSDGGFLIERIGKVTTLDQSGDALPSGLLLAVDRHTTAHSITTTADGARSPHITVHGPAGLQSRIAAWMRATSVRFELRDEWAWHDASDAAIAAAPDLLTPSLRRKTATSIPRRRSGWRSALIWLVAAAALHTGATAIAWANLQWRVGNLERDTAAVIRGAAPDLAGDPGTAWPTYYSSYRHRAGKTAPNDALPLLADAADGLREIGAGSIRAIAFESGQLTIDAERAAASAIASAMPRWRAAGLSVLQAETPAGIRLRLTRE